MEQKLNAKDFILIGILTALMWIICMVISSVMSILGPVTNVFYPPVVAVPNGIVMMLLLARAPKRGVLAICGLLQAILFLAVGAFWFLSAALVVGGVVCDFFIMGRKKITSGSMIAAYTVFTGFFTMGAIGPMRFLQAAFVAATAHNGVPREYIDGLIRMTSVPMLAVIVASGLITGFMGGVLGRKMLKKHFIKAGLASVK